MQLADIITERIRAVTQVARTALHEPALNGNELAYVTECIKTGWVSSVGSYVDRFERDLAEYTGARHAIVVSNGTSGLQVALMLCGVAAGDEVLVPALSFVATANAVRHCGALPHFVDSGYATLGVDPEALDAYLRDVAQVRDGACFNRRTGRRIAALVPMHTFGHPVDMPALMEVARRHALEVVEDAAESLGSWIGDTHTGRYGRCAMLSFNGNKVVTTGGGGAIITDDSELARRAKHLTTTAKLPHAWEYAHDEVAFNYRMPNLNAALGCAQLERLGAFLDAKRELAGRYQKAFADLPEVELFTERAGTRANYWLQTLLLKPEHAHERDAVLRATNEAGQMTRPIWKLLSTLPMYAECESMPTPVAQDLACRLINIPSGPQLVAGAL